MAFCFDSLGLFIIYMDNLLEVVFIYYFWAR